MRIHALKRAHHVFMHFLCTVDITRARVRAHVMLGMLRNPYNASCMRYLSLRPYDTYSLTSHIGSTAYVRRELSVR